MDPSILAILAMLVADPAIPCQRLDTPVGEHEAVTTVVCTIPHLKDTNPLAPSHAGGDGTHERGDAGP